MSRKIKISDKKVEILRNKIAEHKLKPGPLMPSLHDAQSLFGCIPLEIQKIIASELNETVAKINGVVTFYSHFSLEPKGKYVIGVCLGTACYVRGSQGIIDEFSKVFNIKPGETTSDGLISLEATRCIGACGLAPVFTVGTEVYGNAKLSTVDEVIKNIE